MGKLSKMSHSKNNKICINSARELRKFKDDLNRLEHICNKLKNDPTCDQALKLQSEEYINKIYEHLKIKRCPKNMIP